MKYQVQTQSIEYQVQTQRYKIPGTNTEILDTRYKHRDIRYQVQTQRYKIPGTNTEILDTRYKHRDIRYQVQHRDMKYQVQTQSIEYQVQTQRYKIPGTNTEILDTRIDSVTLITKQRIIRNNGHCLAYKNKIYRANKAWNIEGDSVKKKTITETRRIKNISSKMTSVSISKLSHIYRKPASFLTTKTGIAVIVGTMIAVTILCLSIGLAVTLSNDDGDDSSITDPLGRARSILRRVPLIDGHNDFVWQIQINFRGQLAKFDMNQDMREQLWFKPENHPSYDLRLLDTDCRRYIGRGSVAYFLLFNLFYQHIWSAYSNCYTQFKDAVTKGLEQVDLIKRFVKKYSDTFQLVTTADGVLKSFQEGKIASLIGLEGGHMIDNNLSVLRSYYELGRVIKEMNRLGMMIDLSHVSWETMDDVFTISTAPVIYSHSSSFALCPHHRNAPDKLLQKLKTNGGIIMVNFYPYFINCTSETVYQDDYRTASLSQIADHMDHIKTVIGAEHIGLGSDYDGSDFVVTGMEDVSRYPYLFEELIKRGWTDTELENVAFNNFNRVFSKVEEVRYFPP
ncbi:hypothetical protein KUTeg_008146 [Tegillarca granosa]|uniref:Dipeptidase n=1 Tax=Tegillarca granosa TaxID=220873 RepID=A0ABQ9FBE3_TEGGR|nr:hypothetical protein KUTeg_008146 [Tegillarca granosa]